MLTSKLPANMTKEQKMMPQVLPLKSLDLGKHCHGKEQSLERNMAIVSQKHP